MRGCWVDELEKWLPALDPADFNMIRSGNDVARIKSAKITLVTYALLQQPLLMVRASRWALQEPCVLHPPPVVSLTRFTPPSLPPLLPRTM